MLHGNHILKSFDEDLKKVNNYLIVMSQLLIDELKIVLNYFNNNKQEKLINEVLSIENKINDINQKALDLTLEIFTLRSPVASDLRYVFAASQVARSLEKNADNLKKSMKDISGLSSRDTNLDKFVIIMLEKNITMHNIALNAFIKLDPGLANIAEINDDEIDEAFSSLCNLLLQKIQTDPQKLISFYNYLFLGRRLENIGDHVYNIRTLITFIETGCFTEE